MKTSDIREGATYRNRGTGIPTRKVLAIGDRHRPEIFRSAYPPPYEPGVLYEHLTGRSAGTRGSLYLSAFARWAGSEVPE